MSTHNVAILINLALFCVVCSSPCFGQGIPLVTTERVNGAIVELHKEKSGTIRSLRFLGAPSSRDKLNAFDFHALNWKKVKSLQSISLSCDVSKPLVEYIATLDQVTSLSIGTEPSETIVEPGALSPLQQMTSLEQLRITCVKCPPKDLAFLSELESLEVFELYQGGINDEVFSILLDLSHIREIRCWWLEELKPDTYRELGNCTTLERVDFGLVPEPGLLIRSLTNIRGLRELGFSASTKSWEKVSETDMKAIADLPKLVKLKLNASFASCITATIQFDTINELEVHGNRIRNWEFLQCFPRLRVLRVSGTVVETGLAKCLPVTIEELYVQECKLPNDAVTILGKLPHLKRLHVGNSIDSKWMEDAKHLLGNTIIIGQR